MNWIRPRHLQLLFFGLALLLVALSAVGSPSIWAQSPENAPETQSQTLYLPAVAQANASIATPIPVPTVPARPAKSANCIATSDSAYISIPVAGPSFLDASHTAETSPDLNLAMRSYRRVDAPLYLLNINGPTDSDPPQLGGINGFAGPPRFSEAYQVYDWDWVCRGTEAQAAHHGCRSRPISSPSVTLIDLQTTAGSPLYAPSRQSQILGGGYVAMVLYAQADRITLAYTRDDTPAAGYLVHLENICVDPNLLALYQAENQAGRLRLPALRNGEQLGTAPEDTIGVAIRDTGRFMDPRSRKDWWQNY